MKFDRPERTETIEKSLEDLAAYFRDETTDTRAIITADKTNAIFTRFKNSFGSVSYDSFWSELTDSLIMTYWNESNNVKAELRPNEIQHAWRLSVILPEILNFMSEGYKPDSRTAESFRDYSIHDSWHTTTGIVVSPPYTDLFVLSGILQTKFHSNPEYQQLMLLKGLESLELMKLVGETGNFELAFEVFSAKTKLASAPKLHL